MSKLPFRQMTEAEIGMSGHELRRIEVLSEVLARRRTEVSAAGILGLSTRQTRRLVVAYRDGGGGAMIHKARGRSSNNQLHGGIREYVIELVRLRYADFGPSLAAEVLLAKDGVKVSRETLRKKFPFYAHHTRTMITFVLPTNLPRQEKMLVRVMRAMAM
jgi:hypothetical protein